MPLIYNHVCLNCNSKFQSINPRVKYCSHKCYWIRLKGVSRLERKTGRKYFCIICHKSFYRSKSSTQRYCSRKCYLIDHSKNMREVKCTTCNNLFITSRKTKDEELFCSRKCYLIDHASIMEIFKCLNCNSEFKQSKNLSEKNKFCSLKCANAFNTKNPERNQKIGETSKRQYSSGDRVSWNKKLTKETDERLYKSSQTIREGYQNGREVWNKNIPMTKEQKEKQSRERAGAIVNGKVNYRSGHFFSKKNNKDLYYRSSYELIAYQILEQLGKVQSYEVEPFCIPYLYDKFVRNTVPDLLITYTDGTKELIEVKSQWRLSDSMTDAKLQKMKFFARRKGWNFSIWTEKELRICH